MGQTTLFRELTRPRGCRWIWSLEWERVEAGRPVGLAWDKRFSMTPLAIFWRGGFAAFLLSYALFWNWERIPWPQWPEWLDAEREVPVDGEYYREGCGCMLPEPPRENDPASDATLLVRPLGPERTMVAVRPLNGEPLP